jgi:ribonuclease E
VTNAEVALNTADPTTATTPEAVATEAGAPERRRSRERPGRERRERQARPESNPTNESAAQASVEATAAVSPDAAKPTVASIKRGMPAIQAYTLPTHDLIQVAQAAGMEWVNSNPERVSAVQAAIAAEPKPIHVPRERPAPVVLDEGPLILVETRADLRQQAFGFESSQA